MKRKFHNALMNKAKKEKITPYVWVVFLTASFVLLALLFGGKAWLLLRAGLWLGESHEQRIQNSSFEGISPPTLIDEDEMYEARLNATKTTSKLGKNEKQDEDNEFERTLKPIAKRVHNLTEHRRIPAKGENETTAEKEEAGQEEEAKKRKQGSQGNQKYIRRRKSLQVLDLEEAITLVLLPPQRPAVK